MDAKLIKKVTNIYLLALAVGVLLILIYNGIQLITSSTSINALANTLILVSLFSFFATLVFGLVTLKWNSKNVWLWLVLVINLPVAIIYSPNLFQNIYLKFIDTTTKQEYRYSNTVSQLTYERDIKIIHEKIDSLIRQRVVTQPSDYGERYFEGTTYIDSLERRRGFPATPYSVPLKLHVDTLFYSSDGSNLIAGTVIRKIKLDYPQYVNGDTAQYKGNAFIYNPTSSGFKFITLSTSTSGWGSIDECSRALNEIYLKQRGLKKGFYNLNDSRFWSENQWWKKFLPSQSN